MVIDPVIIKKEYLQKANWEKINESAKLVDEKLPNKVLQRLSKFAGYHVKGGNCDEILKRLAYHEKCKSGIMIDEESITFI